VDFDNNGRRDLLRSAPDVLASTANYLAGYGWQRGKDWEPGSANFAVLQQWNKSEVYARTVASFRKPARPRTLIFLNTQQRSCHRIGRSPAATRPLRQAYFVMPPARNDLEFIL